MDNLTTAFLVLETRLPFIRAEIGDAIMEVRNYSKYEGTGEALVEVVLFTNKINCEVLYGLFAAGVNYGFDFIRKNDVPSSGVIVGLN
jgi:hypothetical protein